MSFCLLPPAERAARVKSKREAVLVFLSQQIFSTERILMRVMGVNTRQGTHRTLGTLEREELIKHALIVPPTGGRGLTIWGITPHGQAMAAPPGTPINARYFDIGRVAYSTLAHTLDIQRARLALEALGWSDFIDGNNLPTAGKDIKRPDAVAFDPNKKRVAIEIERTIKSPKRYQDILAIYLMALKKEEYDRVLWISPTPEITNRVKRIITGVEYVRVAGTQVKIIPERHHSQLYFMSFEEINA